MPDRGALLVAGVLLVLLLLVALHDGGDQRCNPYVIEARTDQCDGLPAREGR